MSPSLDVLQMNTQAEALLKQMERNGAERAVAAPLCRHCRNIIETVPAHLKSNNRARLYRTVGSTIQPTRSFSKDSASQTPEVCLTPES
jgi:hypothetical protein